MALLYTDIDATQANRLYEISGTDKREAMGFTYKGTDLLAVYPVTLDTVQVQKFTEQADRITFWHYGYDKGCSRSVQIDIGNQCFMLDVKSDETLDRPDFIG